MAPRLYGLTRLCLAGDRDSSRKERAQNDNEYGAFIPHSIAENATEWATLRRRIGQEIESSCHLAIDRSARKVGPAKR
jgi:hypothetical protein